MTKQEVDAIDQVHRRNLGQDHAANAVCLLVDEVRRLNEELYQLRCKCGKHKDDAGFARKTLEQIRSLAALELTKDRTISEDTGLDTQGLVDLVRREIADEKGDPTRSQSAGFQAIEEGFYALGFWL